MTTPHVTPTHRAPTAHPTNDREDVRPTYTYGAGTVTASRWATLPSGHGRKARRLPTV